MQPDRRLRPSIAGLPKGPTNPSDLVPAVFHRYFGTEISDQRALWGFVIRLSVLVTVVAELLNLLSVLLFPGAWGFERFAIQTFVIAFCTAIPSTYFVGWTAMQLTRAKAELHVLSRTDGLTGLPNRLAFQEALDGKNGDVLAIVDIDHFKQVNDTYGHPVGDEVIRELGRRIAALQPQAFVSRIGGEEFACIAGNGAAERMARQLELIRAELAARGISVGPHNVPVTLSAGLAIRGERSSQAFFSATDRVLYAAKSQGRNRVLFEDALAADPRSSETSRPAA